ncbi:MAG: GMC family oxidoreductase [Calothrix sp. MO_192.B10]|nr:GMC family oxidoreductase [Calothrix sp. MO_192.B10]
MRTIDVQEATNRIYDVVIVGAGFASAILSKELDRAGCSVLVLEAGVGHEDDFGKYLRHLHRFMRSPAKIPNSPFPTSANAPQPLVTDVHPIAPGTLDTAGYFVQKGPVPFESTYTRRQGGTSLHWFGSCPRMLPEDFVMQTKFGRGVDWPITYEDILPYYTRAEELIGVSADVEDQTYHGIFFPEGYVYPMHKIPQSYLDQWFIQGLAGMTESENGDRHEVLIRSIPQARNSIPNQLYNQGRGYKPQGAVGNPGVGLRCMGNSSCLPICPIQARYNGLKTFIQTKDVEVLNQAVASQLDIDPETGRITGVKCKVWFENSSPEHRPITVRSSVVILAANAIENAKLLLGSGACQTSDQVGRNLMDHPAILSWGLAPQNIGAFRGPGLTSTLVTYRGGAFRKNRAAFVFEIGNWGWNWPKNAPNETVKAFIDQDNLYGGLLRQQISQTIPRQVRVDLMTEQLPSPSNRVTLDSAWVDQLGNHRPVIQYAVDDYTQDGMVFGRAFTQRVFQRLGIEDYTTYSDSDPGYFTKNGEPFAWSGVGHIAGTHRMGTSPQDSVVNRDQQAWDHDNLYVVGCGSFPTLGTSNPSLTMAALACATAEKIVTRIKTCQS